MQPKKHCLIYARVSTEDQSTERQVLEMLAECQRRGWVVVGVHKDEVSGSKKSRPGLDSLMKRVGQGEAEVVMVWHYDRFARSLPHLLEALEFFHSHQVDFLSLSQKIDTSGPMGKFVFQIMGAAAELERSLIAERVKSGIKAARRKRHKGNWGRRPRIIDLDRARQLLREGHSLRSIEAQTGVPRSTLHARLNLSDQSETNSTGSIRQKSNAL